MQKLSRDKDDCCREKEDKNPTQRRPDTSNEEHRRYPRVGEKAIGLCEK